MSRSNPATLDSRSNQFVLTTFLWRQTASLAGFALFGALALAVAALSTWNVADPSFSYATSDEPTNLLGYGGATFADIIRDYYPDLTADDIRACIQYAIDVVAVEDIRLAPTP